MESVIRFNEFMNQHRTSSAQEKTLVGMGGSMKGKFNIPDHDMDEFLKLYSEASKTQTYSLVEYPKETSPCRIDLDFRFRSALEVERKYTDQHLMAVVKTYQDILKQYIDATEDQLTAYCFEKPAPSVTNAGSIADGIHIMFPDINSTPEFFLFCRLKAINILTNSKELESLQLTNTLEDVIDKAVISSNGWMLYGSAKPNKDAYKLTKMVGTNLEIVDVVDSEVSKHYVEMFSVRKEHNVSKLKTASWKEEFKSIGPKPSFQPQVKQDPGSVDPGDVVTLVGMLNKKRAESYNEWIRVGWCLHYLSESCGQSLLPVWKHFSKKSKKYVEKECDDRWQNMKSTSHRLGFGSLRWWAKRDSPEEYFTYLSESINPLLEEAVRNSFAGTSYDVAKVIRAMYPEEHVCTNIKSQTWYSFINGRWREARQGLYLRMEFSTTVFEKFCQLAAVLNQRAADTQKQEYLERAKMANNLARKLRERKFKQDILHECADMFYDGEFMSKLNTNKFLLGFENGVYDLNLMKFRPGQPEDYVTISCGYNYKEVSEADKKHVIQFLKEVFVDETVYNYMRKMLGCLLEGEIRDHHFHFCTGTGSNGKSVLWDCLDKVLGGYSCVVPVAFLTNKRSQSNQAAPEIARAAGARLLQFSEPEKNAVFNEGLMKELTSDTIVVRHLYGESFEIEPQWKLVMLCNKLPQINSYDGGTWRRVRVVPFESKFVDKPKKKMEFKRDDAVKRRLVENKMAFMAVMIDCYKYFLACKGVLEPTEKINAWTLRYKKRSDAFITFIDECLEDEVEGNFGKSMGDLYAIFQQWFRNSGVNMTRPPKSELKDYLEDRMSDKKKGTRWMFREVCEDLPDNWGHQMQMESKV